MMIQKTVLHNGITIVSEKMPGVLSVSLGIWVRVGSRHETMAEQGIAHFIEHMLFKGTSTYSTGEIARVIDSVGGLLNAFTTKEYTCFYVKVLREHLTLAIGLLCDIFFNSLFKQEEIEKERNVIIQEIHMVKDTPDDYVQDLFSKSYFDGHPLGYSILGELETVQYFSRSDICGFFNREYAVPERIVISAAGNIEQAELLEALAGRFEQLSGHMPEAAGSGFVPGRHIVFHERDLEQVHVCMGTAGVSHVDPRRYSLYLLNTILGGSMSSRLFQEIRENHGLAYSIYSFTLSFHDTGLFGLYMGVRKETLKDALQIALQGVRALRCAAVAPDELHHAKEQIKGNILLSLESTDSRMSRLAKCELQHETYIPVEEVLACVDAVTADSILELSRQIFRDESFTHTFLGPVTEAEVPPDTLMLHTAF